MNISHMWLTNKRFHIFWPHMCLVCLWRWPFDLRICYSSYLSLNAPKLETGWKNSPMQFIQKCKLRFPVHQISWVIEWLSMRFFSIG